MKMRYSRSFEVSLLLTMQGNYELASEFYQRLCDEVPWMVLHFTFISQGHHKKARSITFHLRSNAMLLAEYNAYLPDANVPVCI
jgi:hypothetical protein